MPELPAKPIQAKEIRRIILEQSKRAHVGHIGSCLCIAEIVEALYGYVLRIPSPEDPERDRFVLSKGHAALALFAALALRGFISHAQLNTFCEDDTLLGVHPEVGLRGIDFSTGSLGMGLSMAAGAALAARMQRSERRVFCLVSDAELNEGSVWEAIMFAAHQRLTNLTAIVDRNGQQALGLTHDVMDLSNMADRWRTFGWQVAEVDGHSVPRLAEALNERDPDKPRVVIARTVFGKGVSYMEAGISITQTHVPRQAINWHYLPMSDEEYRVALMELEQPA